MRDLADADGLGLIQQRIHRRLIIDRGEFLYDRLGTLGSRLRTLINMGIPSAAIGIEQLVREALSPMDDIIVTAVEVYTYNDGSGVVTDPNNIRAKIEYQLNTQSLLDAQGQFSTDVTLLA